MTLSSAENIRPEHIYKLTFSMGINQCSIQYSKEDVYETKDMSLMYNTTDTDALLVKKIIYIFDLFVSE